MTGTDPAAFDQAYRRFSSWLAGHSPDDLAALRPPARPEQIAALERQLGFALHPELRALLELHNGVEEVRASWDPADFQAGAFLPLAHRLLSTDGIAAMHAILVDFGADNAESGLWVEDDLNGHAHQWVPFATPRDGGVAFIDHRPGPTYGHVYEMGIGSGDIDGTEWASGLTELFAGLAAALEAGTAFRHFWPCVKEHPSGVRYLAWDIRAVRAVRRRGR